MNMQDPFKQKNKKGKKGKKGKSKEALTNSNKSVAETNIKDYTIDSNTKISMTTFLISLVIIITIFVLTIANSERITGDDSIRFKFAAGNGLIGLVMLTIAYSMATEINTNKYKGDIVNAKIYIFVEKLLAPAFLFFTGIFIKPELLEWFSNSKSFSERIKSTFFNWDNKAKSAQNTGLALVTMFYIFMMIIVWLN